jgi:4-coumarate--CoA ligase
LLAEVDALLHDLFRTTGEGGSGRVPDPVRLLVLVPCHHIFGFLFGALLPARAGWPVVDLAGRPPGALAREARPGDLVIATPWLLSLALKSGGDLPGGLSAVVSGAPAPDDLWQVSAEAGLALTEVYGATETGGIGWRRCRHAPFALLSHLARRGGDVQRPDGRALDVQDRLEWRDGRRFAVLGRRDRVVQVAGVNVSPDAVARHLAAAEGVCDAVVRLDAATGRLKAFVVPGPDRADGSTDGVLEARLRAACTDLPAPARPYRYSFGIDLPRGPTGKVADW